MIDKFKVGYKIRNVFTFMETELGNHIRLQQTLSQYLIFFFFFFNRNTIFDLYQTITAVHYAKNEVSCNLDSTS